MRIAVLSDSHDNVWKLDNALPHLAQSDAVLHCGDIVAPFMIVRLMGGLGGVPLHVVWGNNDGDKRLLVEVARDEPTVRFHGDLAEIELGGLKVAVNHYPQIAGALAESGRYDLVCYGHDHAAYQKQIGKTLLLKEFMRRTLVEVPGTVPIYMNFATLASSPENFSVGFVGQICYWLLLPGEGDSVVQDAGQFLSAGSLPGALLQNNGAEVMEY